MDKHRSALAEVALARSSIYKALAALMDRPTDSLVEGVKSGVVGEWLVQSLALLADNAQSYEGALSAAEELRANLLAEVRSLSAQDVHDEHTRVFIRLHSLKCPPYEVEYGYAHIFQKTNAMADVAGFYRAFGVDLSPDSHDRVDGLTTELEFMHVLTAKEAEALETDNTDGAETCSSAQKKFLEEHLGRWSSAFIQLLSEQAPSGPYPAIAAFVETFIACELSCFALTPEPIDVAIRCDEAEIEAQASCLAREEMATTNEHE